MFLITKETKFFIFLILILVNSNFSYSKKDSSDFRVEDKIRINEAIQIFNETGNLIWKDWSNAPFTIILVTNENEYLLNILNPPEDFTFAGYDSLIGNNVFSRPRQFNKNFLATLPAVNGIPTIVVGLPENTGRASTDWIVTLLHEHFHQYQYSQPDYYSSVDSLDLSGGDNSGMWMLNYKFPYDDKEVSDQYDKLTQAAKNTYLSINTENFNTNINSYLEEKLKFKSLLSKKDYDYFSFQLWQEGIARYTEIKIAEYLNSNYIPSENVKQLSDFKSPDSFYVKIVNRMIEKADTQSLPENQRVCFYTLGALEGLILDANNPDWKDLYLKEKFYTEKYFIN